MGKLKQRFGKLLQRAVDAVTGNGLMQEENTAGGELYVTPGISAAARQCAAEGCVLLKNDGTLPLAPSKPVAVFGRCQFDWFYVGYGSGGDVKAPYFIDLPEGLKNAGVACDAPLMETYRSWCRSEEHAADHGWWGHWPMSYPEMPLDDALVRGAAERADTALVVIGRAAGEDRENKLEKGSYYLTDAEKDMLDRVTGAFSHTVVLLNAGSVMDMAWTLDYGDRLSALMILWLGGMESGNAAADVLTGKVNPCGRLADSIAKSYADYPSSANFGGKAFNNYAEGIFVGYRHFDTYQPDRVLFPFGFGLSYTTFALSDIRFSRGQDGVTVTATVENTGACAGRETLLLWASAPAGTLEKPARVLAGFAKTKRLAPQERDTLTLHCDDRMFSSYDDTGVSGHKSAFVLEKGEYRFALGDTAAGSFVQEETIVVTQCEAALTRDIDIKERILSRLPEGLPVTGDRGVKLSDVATDKATLESFVAQLSPEELEGLTRGEARMNSVLGTPGNAGAFGGVTPALREKGVPPVITADGPAGLRLQRYCSLLPCGTALACTFDTALVEELFGYIGREMRHYDIDVILSPGMNIHRDPLCGRNFEYYSEDPVLAGRMAAATVRGVQSEAGRSCCPKHFACNNQEFKRNSNDSRVSERALREIYLRGFELCVKEGRPHTLMTSYNKINGVWSHYNYDLATTVLRGDWGFTGVVVTDWWMRRARSPEFPKLFNNAYRVRAQVDVLMPGDMGHLTQTYRAGRSLLCSLGKRGGITMGELQRTALTVLRFILDTKMKQD